MLKKILVLLLAAIFTWPLLFGCGESTVRDICTYRTRASA